MRTACSRSTSPSPSSQSRERSRSSARPRRRSKGRPQSTDVGAQAGPASVGRPGWRRCMAAQRDVARSGSGGASGVRAERCRTQSGDVGRDQPKRLIHAVSVGRSQVRSGYRTGLQAGGHRFDPGTLHLREAASGAASGLSPLAAEATPTPSWSPRGHLAAGCGASSGRSRRTGRRSTSACSGSHRAGSYRPGRISPMGEDFRSRSSVSRGRLGRRGNCRDWRCWFRRSGRAR